VRLNMLVLLSSGIYMILIFDIFASNICSMLWWIISGIEGKLRELFMILLDLT
jgi:hypothetical protein